MTAPTFSRPVDPHAARRPRDWRSQAACRDHDPEDFFPLPKDTAGIARAKAICLSGCPVLAECLAWAVGSGDAWAVAGGLTPEERRDMRPDAPSQPKPELPTGKAWERVQAQVYYHLGQDRSVVQIAARTGLPADVVRDIVTRVRARRGRAGGAA